MQALILHELQYYKIYQQHKTVFLERQFFS